MNPLNSKAVNKLIIAFIIIIVAVLIMFFTRRAIQKVRENSSKDNIDNPANSIAARLYAEFFPFGEVWAWVYNTDEERIIRLAEEAGKKLIDDVTKAYRLAYNRNLTDDVRRFLNRDEQERFFKAISN